jgi:hypothetical protein
MRIQGWDLCHLGGDISMGSRGLLEKSFLKTKTMVPCGISRILKRVFSIIGTQGCFQKPS